MRDLYSPLAVDFCPADANELADVLKALTDPHRLRIINELHWRGAMPGRDLIPLIGVSQPTTAHHLKILNRAGLISSTKDGHLNVRELDHEALFALAGLLTPGGAR